MKLRKTSRSYKPVTLEAYIRRQGAKREGMKFLGALCRGAAWTLVIGGLLVLGGHLTLRKLLFENPKYAIRHLEIELTGKLRRDQVLSWASIPSDANLLALNLRDLQKRLESQPSVATAEVRRQLPNRLMIRVTERNPIARVVIEPVADSAVSLCYTVDREGIAMRPRAGEDFQRLPEVRGVKSGDVRTGEKVATPEIYSALNLLQLIDASPVKAELDVVYVDVSKHGTLRLSMPSGSAILFSSDSSRLGLQLARLERVIQFCNRQGKSLATADLTLTRNVPVTFRPNGG